MSLLVCLCQRVKVGVQGKLGSDACRVPGERPKVTMGSQVLVRDVIDCLLGNTLSLSLPISRR